MLTLNETKIKFQRTLTLFLRNNDSIDDIKINSTVEFQKLFNIKNKLSKKDCLQILNIIKNGICTKDFLVKFIKDDNNVLNINQLLIYLDFKKRFPSNDGHNLDFYIHRYGEKIGLKKYNKRWDNFKKYHKPNTKEFWMRKGYSEIESIEKSENFKSQTSNTKQAFIKRHGEEKGLEIFKKFQEDSKQTEEKYIKKYGEEEGSKKWEELCTKKRENSVFTTSYWLKKGYSEEESEIMRKEFHKMNLNTSSVDYWISKGMSEQEAVNKVRAIYYKKRVAFSKASGESLKFFKTLLKYLKFENLEYRIGVKGNSEFSIYCKEEKKLYFYDLTIPSINLIIEYNGERFHPNPNKLSKEEWKSWKAYRFQKNVLDEIIVDADTAHKNDLYKNHLAERNGFEVFTVWSSDDKTTTNNKIINLINKKLDENNKNN